MTRALVTGVSGFVGANLARRLLARGHEVHGLVRATSDRWRIDDLRDDLPLHDVDLADRDRLTAVVRDVRPEAVYHVAAASAYGERTLGPRPFIDANVTGTVNLLEACASVGFDAFVNTGSSSEYGPSASAMREDQVCRPVNAYGVTKLAATRYGAMLGRTRGLPVVGIRLFSPYGPFEEAHRLIPYVLTRLLRGEPLALANPDSARDYVHIDDVLDLYETSAAQAATLAGEVLNAGGGHQRSVAEVLAAAARAAGGAEPAVRWRSAEPRPWDTDRWEADLSHVTERTGWTPRRDLDEGLRLTLDWFRAHADRAPYAPADGGAA